MFYVKINWEIISPWNSLKYMMIRSAWTIAKVSGFSSVQLLSRTRLRLPCPSLILGASSNSSPSSWWCHPTISPSVVPLSCLQSFPASGSFQMSRFFTSGGQSIGVSASASVLPVNIQDWFPLGWTGWISLQSKGLSRVFSNTTVQKLMCNIIWGKWSISPSFYFFMEVDPPA